ncbi:MAG: hypothetical protein Q9163_001946 [Psora crenata]
MAGAPPLSGRHVPPPGPNDTSEFEALRVHGRDVSGSRGRIPTPGKISMSNIPTNGLVYSPRSQSSATSARSPVINGQPERRPSQSHGHLRQSSKAQSQGRNGSFANSPTTSPMSPELATGIAESSGSMVDNSTLLRRGTSQRQPGKWASNNLQASSYHSAASTLQVSSYHSTASTSTLTSEKDMSDIGAGPAQRRLDRSQGSRNRQEHSHHRSSSRNHHEQKTVGEYALHHLFTRFLPLADHKIKSCVMDPSDPANNIEAICGPGADHDFDQLLAAMAHITRRKPRHLVDTVMLWRLQKVNRASDAGQEASPPNPLHKGLPRRPTDFNTQSPDISSVENVDDESKYIKDYKFAVVIYLTCRVLIEVFNEADATAIPPDVYDRLESIIFDRLKDLDPNTFSDYPFRRANYRIYTQVVGVMSSRSLQSVANCFLKDLKASQRELNARGVVPKELENRVEFTIMSMQHVQIRVQPEGIWRESCDFLLGLADLFVNAHGAQTKYAYCRVLAHLLLPVVSNWGLQMNTQKFRDFLTIINPRISGIVAKPRHWADAIGLSSMVLCASPTDQFASSWLSAINNLQTKLKDRNSRALALQAWARLVWTYLERIQEPATTIRRLDEMMKTVLPSGKKTSFTLDAAVCEPLIELIRIIGYHHQEYCFRSVIFPLINSDLFATGKDIRVEQLEPERMVIGIRAFLMIMADLELAERGKPPFPRFGHGALATDPIATAGNHLGSHRSGTAMSACEAQYALSSRPVAVAKLPSSAREFHARFCEILGKITIICDNAFGGQAVLDEKFSGGYTPKTPLADSFGFGRRDDHQGPTEQRLGFYELLHVAVQALPRCLPAHVQLKPLINLLCTCTAHVQSNIAASSIQSLKAIARQSFAQAVTIGFARFIFNFDARYSTMSEEGLLGPDHIESTLSLYVELLQVWIEEIKQKTKEVSSGAASDGSYGSRGLQLDLTSVSNHVDEVESHGVFFLCSQSRRVRVFAVKVLKIVTEFDTALGRQNPRIIQILEGDSQRVIDMNDESLTVAERSRLQKGKSKGMAHPTLVELSSSDVSYDATLWLKVFPNIIRLSFDLCPSAVMLGRGIVCTRLLQMYDNISFLDTDILGLPIPSSDYASNRTPNRLQSTSPPIIIEQWKLYLIMACTTVTNAGAQTQSQLDKTQHARKISKPVQQGQDKISSARALFAYVIPLLASGQSSVRDAIVIALSSININLYRTLLESLQYAVTTCKEEAKQRIGSHQRTGSNPRKNPSTDRLRTGVTQVYKLTARFLQEQTVLQDDWILSNLCTYTRDLMIFLGDSEIQADWECQKLRQQYCGLLEELFNGVNRTKDDLRYIPFEARKSAFALMEDWCGYSPNQARIAQREDTIRQIVMQRHPDARERTNITASMETEKRDLSMAALSAMAALCAGPVRLMTDRGETLSFDSRRMLSWIDQVFGTQTDKQHAIGRRALYNLIVNNRDIPYLLEVSIEQCYTPDRPRALESYFDVVTRVLNEYEDYPIPFWRVLAALLFLLGNEKSEIRIRAAKLLQRLEQRRQQNSKIQDFDISISDRTTAVHKLASFEISRRLSKEHKELAFFIFSQFSFHFRNIHPDNQRQMVYAILPWIQMIELQVGHSGNPTSQSYMLLANLLEITTKSSSVIHNEVQALWKALATGHAGNVQLVLDFVISLCLDRRDQTFVYYAKQIIVYMAGPEAGPKVVEFLLLQITPKNMVHTQREPFMVPTDNQGLPYVANLSEALPVVNKQDHFSLSQLSLVFLVDLIVAPMTVKSENVPLLLQGILVLWDNQISLVQEQAREMLVHLIHELVITKIPQDMAEVYASKRNALEAFVESVRHHEPGVVWQYRERVAKYEEWNARDDAEDDKRVPAAMPEVAAQVVEIFGIVYPDIQDRLARISLSWGTSCSVRHAACRSLQIFRCVLVPLDRPMLSDILARISNTVVHEADDVQTFSMEMLTTVKSIIAALEPAELLQYPHLFWTTCACLDTIFEREFVVTLGMLDKLLPKLNLTDPAVVKLLRSAKPSKWQGTFEGVTPLVYKGLKSEMSLATSLRVLDSLVSLPDIDLIGNHTRLLFTILANLPRFLQSFVEKSKVNECIQTADILSAVAEAQAKHQVSIALNTFGRRGYTSSGEFLSRILATLRTEYFPTWELKVLIFVIGLLTNRLRWYKLQAMEVLRVLITDVDTRRSEISNCGPDLISPLLRLLQTEFCPQAISILDHISVMSETPLSKQHMRMSMAGLGSGSISVRKEYEKTQSLYGIPEETGWSIPMPAIRSNTTRTNMQLIYQECANPSVPAAEAIPTPEIELDPEDDPEASYFSLERSDTIRTEDAMIESSLEGGMSELLTKLNSLNDFFDETLDANNDASNHYSGITAILYNSEPDTGAEIYDHETTPILQKTLARTASISSIHNNATERSYPTVMTPTAFKPPILPNTAPTRPSLHSRSVTSPANNLAKASTSNVPELLSDEEADEIFSEDERSTGHAAANDSRLLGSTSLRRGNSTMRKMAPGLEGKDYKQRGLLRAQSRGHNQAPGSPMVPKVPDAYLRDAGQQS